MPATSQLDWLISMTAMIVLFWSRVTRDLLRSFGWGIWHSISYMQRRSCHFLAARPIASLGPPPPLRLSPGGKIPGLQAKTSFAAFLRAAGEEREWVSGPGCGPVGNCKSRRRAQGLV